MTISQSMDESCTTNCPRGPAKSSEAKPRHAFEGGVLRRKRDLPNLFRRQAIATIGVAINVDEYGCQRIVPALRSHSELREGFL